MPASLFFSTFVLIFLAELPDKTALAAIILASRHKPLAVLLGICLAFIVQGVVAILFGTVIGMIPMRIIEALTGIMFLVFAVSMWRKHPQASVELPREGRTGFWAGAKISFLTIFALEWGDFTQISTAAIVARSGHPVVVFTAATLALWSVSAMAVFLGHRLGRALKPRILELVAAVVFGCAGGALLVRAFF